MWYLLTRGLVGPQSGYGRFGEDTISCPSRDCEPPIPTALSRPNNRLDLTAL